MNTETEDQLLTRKDLAALLGVTPWWLKVADREGRGPARIALGTRTVRYRRSAVEEWLTARETVTARSA